MPTDIKTLTREEKLRRLDLIEEKKRRLRAAIPPYAPNDGQLPVHKSEKTLRCVFSGNGAGKTALAVNEALWFCQGFNPVTKKHTKVPARVIVLLDHPDKVSDVWLPELAKWATLTEEQLHKRGKPYIQRISFGNGSEILFMFHEQNPLIFESIEFDDLVADEPPPRQVYIALRRGARKAGTRPKFLLIGTPITAAWMRREIVEPWSKGELTDVECFTFGTAVNVTNLAEGFIEEFSAILSEKERRIRLHGEFFDLEGLALSHLFAQETHVIEAFEWDSLNPVVIAIDPHPAKPHHAVMVGIDKDGYLYYLKELRVKCIPREFARILKQWVKGYRVVDMVSDSLGSSEYTGGEGFKSFIQVLNDEGLRVRATSWDEKSDEDFIARIQDVLAIPTEPNNFGDFFPRLRILQGNPGIVNDIENVQWVKHRDIDEYKPKLDIQNKDFLSCVKYCLATNLTFNKQKASIYRRTRGAETYGVRNQARKTRTAWGELLNGKEASRSKRAGRTRNEKGDRKSRGASALRKQWKDF
jgi:hypothetical protein